MLRLQLAGLPELARISSNGVGICVTSVVPMLRLQLVGTT
jgi:hypothetical protein